MTERGGAGCAHCEIASSPNDVRASHSKRVTRLWRGRGYRCALDHLAQGGKPGQPIGEAFVAPILKSFIPQAAILRGAQNCDFGPNSPKWTRALHESV